MRNNVRLNLTACIHSAPVGRSRLCHIFTCAIATVKTSYTRGTLGEIPKPAFKNEDLYKRR